jgi:hypothetical protein
MPKKRTAYQHSVDDGPQRGKERAIDPIGRADDHVGLIAVNTSGRSKILSL